MKNLLLFSCALLLASCGGSEPKAENAFDDPKQLVISLSQNGIGELKEWANPMEMGWGSLTNYYTFGPGDMQNNISYYLEGTEAQVTKLSLNLNTFTSLSITMPAGLDKAILEPSEFKGESGGYLVSNQLEKSKIETWKIVIKRK